MYTVSKVLALKYKREFRYPAVPLCRGNLAVPQEVLDSDKVGSSI